MKTDAKLSGELSLPAYWKLSRDSIATVRKWGTITRTSSGGPGKEKSTEEKRETYIRQCDRNMEILSKFLPDKPMVDLSAFELLQAVQLSKYSNGKEYAESTLKGRLSLLRDIYSFAEDRGDASNDLDYISDKQLQYYLKAVGMTPKERKKIFRDLVKDTRAKARSLLPSQQAKLVRIILDHIQEDGRYLALAILLYTGMRPSECRGLCWCDLVSFLSHPERHLLPVGRQRDKYGQALVDRLKRPASYRKIGVHFELEKIIQSRLDFTLKSFSSFDEISLFPMCSYKNEFSRGCTYAELNNFASDILKKSIRVSEEVMTNCTLDLLLSEEDLLPSDKDGAEDLRIVTYVLRHDFWTWMQASTELSADEKRYLFGHAIYNGKTDIRPLYNNEDILWDMLIKLDHTIKYYPLHAPLFQGEIGPVSTLSAPNKGHYTLTLSPELLRTGGRVTMVLQANEYDDPIIMKTLSSAKSIFQNAPLHLQATLLPHTREETYRKKSNLDYDNRQVRRLTKAVKEEATKEEEKHHVESSPCPCTSSCG